MLQVMYKTKFSAKQSLLLDKAAWPPLKLKSL
jgi:hypothetical protein